MILTRPIRCNYTDFDMNNWFYFSTKVCGWLFAVPALIWLCVACCFWVNRIDRQFSWEKTTAIVTDMREVEGEESELKHASFTFTDPQTDKSVTVNSQIASSGIYSIGESVEVIFPVGQPEEAIENNFIVNYLEPLLFTLAAIMFGLVSIVSFVVAKKLKSKVTAAP